MPLALQQAGPASDPLAHGASADRGTHSLATVLASLGRSRASSLAQGGISRGGGRPSASSAVARARSPRMYCRRGRELGLLASGHPALPGNHRPPTTPGALALLR